MEDEPMTSPASEPNCDSNGRGGEEEFEVGGPAQSSEQPEENAQQNMEPEASQDAQHEAEQDVQQDAEQEDQQVAASADAHHAPMENEQKTFPLERFQAYCNKFQVPLSTRNVAGLQIHRLKSNKKGFESNSNDCGDIIYDSGTGRHGIVVSNRNACRAFSAGACTYGDKCKYYHKDPGDIVDNFIGNKPKTFAEAPAIVMGDSKAKEYRWSERDLEEIARKRAELMETFKAAALQNHKRKKQLTLEQEQKLFLEELEAKGDASSSEDKSSESDSDSDSDESSSSDSSDEIPPPKKKRKVRKTASKRKKAGKRAPASKKKKKGQKGKRKRRK